MLFRSILVFAGRGPAFGQIGFVKSHKGPFAPTLPKFTASPSCSWIGRDFGSSTSDVMTLLDHLPD